MVEDEFLDNMNLDRLVDGELSDPEYRDVLRRLDEHPDGWRRCALSFLEQQALRKEFRQLLASGTQFVPRSDAPPSADQLASAEAAEDKLENSVDDEWNYATVSSPWDRWLSQPLIRWTAVLAVGVLAFVNGIVFRPFRGPVTSVSSNVVGTTPAVEIQPIPRNFSDLIGSQTAMVAIDHLPGNRSQSFQVPVRRFSQSTPLQKIAQEQMPPQIDSLLSDLGSIRRLERRIYSFRTSTGEIVLLPVDWIVATDDFQ